MDVKDFTAPSGSLVTTLKGFPAFSPLPLPPDLAFDKDLVGLLSRADTALAELSATGRHLPNPHLLISPYIRREAVLSSKIEGTQTSLSDLLFKEAEDEEEGNDLDASEVRNYVRAMEHGVERLTKLPLSLRLVREIHGVLMRGVRGANKTPGEFRTGQNIVGSKGADERTAPYVPPPVDQMTAALIAWENYLNQDDGLPLLIQCALQHVQFETIHPFWDGNGRVGRLLIPLFLISRGKLSQPLLYLSAYIEEHRQDYYDLLQRVRTRSEWDNWLKFFLTGIIEIASEGAEQAKNLIALREEYRLAMKSKPKALALIDYLFANPYITIARAQQFLKVSQPTAGSAVAALEREGILREATGRVWRRIYVATRILDVINPRRKDAARPAETPTR